MKNNTTRTYRVVFLSPFQRRLQRGIERAARNLALQLAEAGHEISFVSQSGDLDPDPALIAQGVGYYRMPDVRYFASVYAGYVYYPPILLRLKPDVVICFFAGYGEGLALRLIRPFQQPAVVFTVGYPLETTPYRFEEFKSTRLDQQLSAVVVKARYMAPAIEQFFGKATHLIPNGVDIAFFDPTLFPDRATNGGFHLVTVAAIEKRKGFDLVLAALPDVMEAVGSVRYTIVGEGSDRAWLETQIRERGLTEYVTLTGAVDDVRPYLAEADVFLLPSYGEGLPNAYLEALAMGLPSIVSTDPPYDEIAGADFSIQVERSDQSAMVAAICGLLDDSEKRHQMGQCAREEAVQKYAWRSIAQRYLGVFERICE